MSALTRFAFRLGRFITLYSFGMGVNVVVGLVTTVVIVHHLSPAAYGVLSLYLLIPSTLLVLANMGLIQGTTHAIARHAGDGDGDPVRYGLATRRVLGTGLVLSLISGTAFALVAIALAPQLSRALGDSPHGTRLVVIGAISGALAGGWRLTSNTMRYARRPIAWMFAHVSRAAFGMIAVTVLVVEGHSLEGVILGFGIGTAAGFALSLWITRSNIAPAFDRGFAIEVLRGARSWIPIVIAYQVILSTGILFLSASASNSQVGLYSLASSVAIVAHYVVSAFIYSVGPLRRSALAVAAVRESDDGWIDARLFEGFTAMAATIVLFLGVFGDLLIKFAPRSYNGAAALVPMLALPAVGRGFFAFTYSLSPAHDKKMFQRLAVLSCVVFVGLALLLGHLFKAYGIPVAGFVAFMVSAAIQFARAQRGARPWPVSLPRVLLPPVVAGFAVVGEIHLRIGIGPVAIAAKLAILAAFLGYLWLLGLVPVAAIRQRLFASRSERPPGRRLLVGRVGDLAPVDADLLRSLVRERRPVAAVANERDESEAAALTRLGTLMGFVSGLGAGATADPHVSRYLVFDGPYGDRDHLARRLLQHGTDPITLDRLEQVVSRVRRLPRSAFRSHGMLAFDDSGALSVFPPPVEHVEDVVLGSPEPPADEDLGFDDGFDDGH